MSSEGPAKATMLTDSEFAKWAQRVLEEESELALDEIGVVDFTQLQTDLKDKAQEDTCRNRSAITPK